MLVSLDFTLAIDGVTGVVTIAQPLDRERLQDFTTVIVATDQGSGFNRDNVSEGYELSSGNYPPSLKMTSIFIK